jgi:DNA-binding winged helix-turn-helix (wHTH) protein
MADVEQYYIGRWRFDVADAVLSGPAGDRRLEDRAARTLTLLCRRRGETVSHAEILAEVWQSRAVSSNSIAVVVADLRRSLDDDARDPTHIATLAKRGYRLNRSTGENAKEPSRRARTMISRMALAAIAVALLTVAAIAIHLSRVPHPIVMIVTPVANQTGSATYAPLCDALGELVTNRVARIRDVTLVSARDAPPASSYDRAILLSSRLILWNGVPTLSLTATDRTTGTVVWAAMAAGPADALAGTTIDKLKALGDRARSL